MSGRPRSESIRPTGQPEDAVKDALEWKKQIVLGIGAILFAPRPVRRKKEVVMVPSLRDCCSRGAAHLHGEENGWKARQLHVCAEIIPAIDDILAALENVGYSSKEMFAVRLALEEALVNAIKHGHGGDPSKEVRLRYSVTRECIVAEIEDQGPGFKPQEVADPLAPENLERAGGRGLLLIRTYMSWVRFNSTGNCVTMCRLRKDA